MAHNTEMMIHGAMTDVTVLDQPADWVDYAAAAARWSHRNLLDNAYWANPDAIIDQRGGYVVPPGTTYYNLGNLAISIGELPSYATVVRYATYDGVAYPVVKVDGTEYMTRNGTAVRGYTGAGYGIDRWRIGSAGTLTIEDGYITFASSDAILRNLEQVLETLEVGKYTISLLVENAAGTNLIIGLVSGFTSATISTNEKQVVSLTFDVTTKTSGTVYIQTANSSIKLYAAKLELGTVQTLAHQDENGNWVLNDPPPDKGMELLRCIQSTADSGDGYANKVVLHTGNKPSGSYTGNGSAAARTINTGGIGNAIIVRNSYMTCIVTNDMAFAINSSGTVKAFTSSEISFLNGVLTLQTSDTWINNSSNTYLYQVL